MDILMLLSLAVLFVGVALLGTGCFIFVMRAISNKAALDGPTKPLIIGGAILTIVGIALVYSVYPFK
jgi:divalent metal cation (Fe/Co/Zn/Cd) transporter